MWTFKQYSNKFTIHDDIKNEMKEKWYMLENAPFALIIIKIATTTETFQSAETTDT